MMQTMQQMLMQYQQIALALAQKYEPDTAEMIAGTIMGAANDQAAQSGSSAPLMDLNHEDDRKTPLMKQMEQRVQNSTQPGA